MSVYKKVYTFVCLLIVFSGITPLLAELVIHDHSIITQKRLDLTRVYAKRHYGLNHYFLIQPQIIVVHYTVTNSLRSTMTVFSPATIPPTRDRLAPYGQVNVGAHYVIDRNGDIYSLIPTTVMARHAMGFNHVAIGIENVAAQESDLTKKQLDANVALIAFLKKRHPSIRYLIGHQSYMNITYPHFSLYSQKDDDYEPFIKIDPGWSFMRRVREDLYSLYQLKFER